MRSSLVLIAVLFLPGLVTAQDRSTDAPELPATIPIFPLPDVTFFPHSTQPFHIFEGRYGEMVADALAGDSIIGMVTLQPGFEDDYEGRPPVHELGSAGVIVASERLDDGRYNILLRGFAKFRIVSEDRSRSYRIAEVEEVSEAIAEVDRPVLAERRHQLEAAVLSAFPGARLPSTDTPHEEAIDELSLAISMRPEERMDLLEARDPIQRALTLIRRLRGGSRSSI